MLTQLAINRVGLAVTRRQNVEWLSLRVLCHVVCPESIRAQSNAQRLFKRVAVLLICIDNDSPLYVRANRGERAE